jgi:hypothetical protein
MSKAQRTATAKKLAAAVASDPFLKGDDVNLDLRGFPSMQPLEDTSFEDEKFAPLSGSGSADAKDLRAFLEQETNRAQGPGEVNLGKGVVGKVAHDGQQWTCDFTHQGKLLRTKDVSREECMMKASRYVFNYRPDIRKLNETELREVAMMAQGGDAATAAEKYLMYAISAAGELGEKIFTDSRFEGVIDQAVWTAWAYSHDDYSLSDREFRRYAKDHCKGKRFTLTLLDSAWTAYKVELQKQARAKLFEPQPEREPNKEDFEEMTDAQVEAQYRSVAAAHSRR